MEKITLSGLFPQELCETLGIKESYKGKQIFKWISSGAESFDEMTNISKELRSTLAEKAQIHSCKVSKVLRDGDDTVKLQIATTDGLAIETVLLMDKEGRKTACVSCQAGCAMGCAFCKTGTLGFTRNLTAGEIVEQFLFLEKEVGTLSNIVFMGMGEPLLNIEEIRKAIAILTNKDGRGLSSKRITLSTCGIIKGIYDLADNGPKIRLAVSLTAADQTLRERLMPVAKANPLPELKKAIGYYAQKSGKRVTLEAALMDAHTDTRMGYTNTDRAAADQMIEFAQGIDVNVNLIPWNTVESLPFTSPSREECDNFMKTLQNAGINVTLRRHRGRGINGACGQLGSTSFNVQSKAEK